jgi:hypothetical protein
MTFLSISCVRELCAPRPEISSFSNLRNTLESLGRAATIAMTNYNFEKEPFLDDEGAGSDSLPTQFFYGLKTKLWLILHMSPIATYTTVFVLSIRHDCRFETSLHRKCS